MKKREKAFYNRKLSPVAFTLLNDKLIRAFYEDGDFKTYKGFRLLAMDRSVMELPNTKETQTVYGYASIEITKARAKELKRGLMH